MSVALHICWTPMTEVCRSPDGERWCFVCRKRNEFERVTECPADDSWYGPSQRIECAVCKTVDGDLFPGRYREWE